MKPLIYAILSVLVAYLASELLRANYYKDVSSGLYYSGFWSMVFMVVACYTRLEGSSDHDRSYELVFVRLLRSLRGLRGRRWVHRWNIFLSVNEPGTGAVRANE